jgi:hypothetical protein
LSSSRAAAAVAIVRTAPPTRKIQGSAPPRVPPKGPLGEATRVRAVLPKGITSRAVPPVSGRSARGRSVVARAERRVVGPR